MVASDLAVDENLSQFYQDHHPWLLTWLERRVDCRLRAEDHAQDTFMRVIESRHVQDIHEPRAYLTTIAKGLLINHWRKSAIEQAYLDRIAAYPEKLMPSAEENAIILVTLQEIDDLLEQLPAKVRKAFLMAQLEGLTYVQIALQIGVSERMVKKYMARAMLHCLSANI